MAAGWLLLAIVDIVWLVYFTSEEGSLSLHIFNITGTGGLTGPGRNGFRSRHTDSRLNPQGAGMSGGYGGGGIGNGHYAPAMPDMGMAGMRYDTKEGDMGMGGVGGTMDNSYSAAGRDGGGMNPAATSIRTSEAPTSPRSSTQPITTSQNNAGDANPATPLMDNNANADGETGAQQYRAKALYNCKFRLDIRSLLWVI